MYEYTILLKCVKFAYLSYIKNHILYFSFINIFDKLRKARLSKLCFSNNLFVIIAVPTILNH